MPPYVTVVVGGGPAGLIAAYAASNQNNRVILLEKNSRPGLKLSITGKGRCNLTNNCEAEELLNNIPRNPKFLLSAISAFSVSDTMKFFEDNGLPLKTERGNRVFPASDKASDVVACLTGALKKAGVEIRKGTALRLKAPNQNIASVVTAAGEIPCDCCIIATGGLSYPKTGSTGDGYRMAMDLGHKVEAPKASLVPLEADYDICSALQGLSLKNVSLTVYEDQKAIFNDFGEMLFTHFGVSGPLVLSASAHMRRFGQKTYALSIDLKPALDESTLDKRILRDFSENLNRDLLNGLSRLLPQKLIPAVISRAMLPPDKKIHSVTKEERARLAGTVKRLELEIIKPRPIEEAVVTSGGIDLREVNPGTMESKLINGLFFAGEVLDLDAYTGGFNLQIAWSTGFLAGKSAGERALNTHEK